MELLESQTSFLEVGYSAGYVAGGGTHSKGSRDLLRVLLKKGEVMGGSVKVAGSLRRVLERLPLLSSLSFAGLCLTQSLSASQV